MSREFVLATGNPGKLREISGMLEPLGFVVHPQSDWQFTEAKETATTFIENALIKARLACRVTDLPSIADDSGLVVPSLNGEPGIFSARYAGKPADDKANMFKLLDELKNRSGGDRRAFFYCAMVFLSAPDDPAPLMATARWHGEILMSPSGDGGFGYDPLFGISSNGGTNEWRSAAQLTPSEKILVSHRGQALRKLVDQLRSKKTQRF
jgi:XTP/dITP diphosphohydrolase